MARPKSEFTPTELRMLEILNDGLCHTKEELSECLDDNLSSANTVWSHTFNLRRKLKMKGLGILFEKYKCKHYYRQVRFIGKWAEE